MLPWRSQASHLTPEPCRLATRHSQNAATHPKSLHCNACNERNLHINVEGNTHCVRLCARASSTQTIFDLSPDNVGEMFPTAETWRPVCVRFDLQSPVYFLRLHHKMQSEWQCHTEWYINTARFEWGSMKLSANCTLTHILPSRPPDRHPSNIYMCICIYYEYSHISQMSVCVANEMKIYSIGMHPLDSYIYCNVSHGMHHANTNGCGGGGWVGGKASVGQHTETEGEGRKIAGSRRKKKKQ